MKPIEAYSLYKLNKLSSDRIVSLANKWLEDGLYTSSLGDLGFVTNPIMSDVAPIFENAMKELGLKEPNKLEAAKILIRMTLNQIVEKDIPPDKGASFLYWDVHHEITDEFPDKKYVGDNLGLEQIFCWLREIWDCRDGSRILYHTDLPRPEAEKKFLEYLVDESRKWLEVKT